MKSEGGEGELSYLYLLSHDEWIFSVSQLPSESRGGVLEVIIKVVKLIELSNRIYRQIITDMSGVWRGILPWWL